MYKRISKNEVNKVIDLCLSNKFYEFDTSPPLIKKQIIFCLIIKKEIIKF